MKTGAELWATYAYYTRDVTEHARKLGFAGAAICWLFKKPDFTFPISIYGALLCFVVYFLADILQSVLAALVHRLFTQHHEKKQIERDGTIDFKVGVPLWLDRPAFCCFCLKIVALIAGFGWIGLELIRKIF